MEKANTILDDICVDIGYTATNSLAGWFGGNYLKVPVEITRDDPIAHAIGYRAATRLAAAWGGKRIWIPLAYWHGIDRRDRLISELVAKGIEQQAIADSVGLTLRRVQQIVAKLERFGLVEFVGKNAAENAEGKMEQENPD